MSESHRWYNSPLFGQSQTASHIRLRYTALLEADVNVSVVRHLLARIREQAVGAEVSNVLDPAQQVVKVVHAELVALLGDDTLKITYVGRPLGQVEFTAKSWY